MSKRAAFALTIPIACAVYDSSLIATNDAGSDAPVVIDAGAEAEAGCARERPPPRPTADDQGGSDVEVMDAVILITIGSAKTYDLDNRCTCPESESCKGLQAHCDSDGGGDNTGGAVIKTFATLSGELDESKIMGRFWEGATGLLFRIRKYNGLANDTSVELSVYVSNGTTPLDDAGTHPVPDFDAATTTWSVEPGSLVGGVAPPYVPKYVDGNAYVTNHVVVASLSFPLGLGGKYSTSFIDLHGAIISATLQPRDGSFSFEDGRVVGRWGTRNLLTSLQVVGDPFHAGEHLCGSNVTYQGIKSQFCKAADITSDLQNDNTNAPCDAISLAVGFRAVPAAFGGVLPNDPPETPCGATYSDQCF